MSVYMTGVLDGVCFQHFSLGIALMVTTLLLHCSVLSAGFHKCFLNILRTMSLTLLSSVHIQFNDMRLRAVPITDQGPHLTPILNVNM